MIYRPAGDRVLMDYEALWVHCGQPAMSTLRAKCAPVACDLRTRLLLFDADDSAEIMRAVKRRAPHRRVARTDLTMAGL